MSQTDLANSPSATGSSRRRGMYLLATVVLLGVTIAWLISPDRTSKDDDLHSQGYMSVGTQDGDTFWAKQLPSREISVVSTGRDGSICNGTGPDVVGMSLCSGGVPGQAYIIVMVAPAGTAKVRLDTSLGSRTLTTLGRVAASPHVIACGVFRGEQNIPVVIGQSYVDSGGKPITG